MQNVLMIIVAVVAFAVGAAEGVHTGTTGIPADNGGSFTAHSMLTRDGRRMFNEWRSVWYGSYGGDAKNPTGAASGDNRGGRDKR